MKLTDIINNCENVVKDRMDYIFASFQKEFNDICYDERSSIVGIGEPGKYLLCYFKKTNEGEILVKFKSNDKPVSILDDIVSIDSYINETIDMFKTNDFLLKGGHSKENSDNQRKWEYSFENKEIDELIEETVSTKGEILIRDIGSRRLTNALYNAGIKTILDLRGWTASGLLEIKNFGKACLEELYYNFFALKQEGLPKETADNDIKYLSRKASKGMVKKFLHNENVDKYLTLIKFDENQFKEGTIGRVLCLREKIPKGMVLPFCENAEDIYRSYLDNKGKFENLLQETKTLLTDIVNQIVYNERDKEIVLALLSIDGKNTHWRL